VWVGAFGLAFLASVAACGGGSKSEDSDIPTETGGAQSGGSSGSGPKVDAATAGELKGAVALNGAVPKNEVIRMNADPVCVKQAKGGQTSETYLVSGDGKSLGNVFVYVKDGLGNYSYDAPPQATLNQEGCHYIPHVFGVRVGQPLEIINSDPTLHNIHAMPKANREFNNGQPIQGMKTTHSFTAKEVMVPFKCDVHGWMNAYVGVLDHPFFAVTDAEGKFDIKGLPPGTYTIEAWHEKLGAQTQSVTIAAKETKEIAFTMNAAAATTTN
jgi:hypothetical protein